MAFKVHGHHLIPVRLRERSKHPVAIITGVVHDTGQIIEAEGGRIAIADGWRSTEGIDKGSRWAPADVGTALEAAMATAVPAQQVWGT